MTDRAFGAVTVLTGADRGRYPSGNSLLVAGPEQRVLIDPSLAVHERGGSPEPVDLVLLSHAHEDHLAGLHLFPDVPVLAHPGDVERVRSTDALLDGYGLDPEAAAVFARELVDDFHIAGRPDAGTFTDGACFDLGGGRTVTVLHLPGHTAGHCGLLVEPEGFFFLGDIDLSAFGPYYGDTSSSLEDFAASMARCREVDARWFATFHHKGVVEGRAKFLAELDAFETVVRRRDEAMLGFLAEPRSLAEMVAHRFVYRPHVDLPFVAAVERRTAELHLGRLLARGQVEATDDGRYCTT
ncbi:MAG: beta-lactamase domain protein [Frankiales bacterium]|nr:beta-lactamase domain protein [Frankiales bacterium]